MGAARDAELVSAYAPASGGDTASKGDVVQRSESTHQLHRPGTGKGTRIVAGQRAATPAKTIQRAASAPALRPWDGSINIKGIWVERNAPLPDLTPPPSPKLTPREMEQSVSRLSRPRSSSMFDAERPRLSAQKLNSSAQGLGVRRTAPSFGFGASTRDDANKVFVSQQHTMTIRYGLLSPGPQTDSYTLPAAIGGRQPAKPNKPSWKFGNGNRMLNCGKLTQKPGYDHRKYDYLGSSIPDGAIPNAPSVTFGASTREIANQVYVSEKHTLSIRAGTQSPGPVYILPASVGGKQACARYRSQPSAKLIGKARAKDEPGLDTPAAIYNLPETFGYQPSRKHRSEPSFSFASKARPPVEAGISSPGPAAPYKLPSAIEKQPRAGKRSAPGVAFTQRSRWADLEREQRKNSVPGPGYYG